MGAISWLHPIWVLIGKFFQKVQYQRVGHYTAFHGPGSSISNLNSHSGFRACSVNVGNDVATIGTSSEWALYGVPPADLLSSG